MNLKIELQFFGGGGSKTTTIPKRYPEPEGLTNLRNTLYEKIYPGLESFNSNSWGQAQNLLNQSQQQQQNLLSQVPTNINRSNDILNKIVNVTETGEIPTGLANNLNSIVNKGLQNSMGNMLNSLGNRGVLNSSITGQGISRLGEQAADAFNKNYLTAYNTVLGGYGQALQGSQNNLGALLQSLSALGSVPSQAYEGAYAGLMPAFNMWKNWEQFQNTRPEEYDTVITQKGLFG